MVNKQPEPDFDDDISYEEIIYPVPPNAEQYVTHRNGDQPFRVVIYPTHLCVYNNTEWAVEQTLLLTTEYIDVFVGSNKHSLVFKERDLWLGNTILIHVPSDVDQHFKYISLAFIDMCVFYTQELVLDYYSTVGRNDVPYPVALTATDAILIIEPRDKEMITVPLEYVTLEGSPYLFYYTNMEEEGPERPPFGTIATTVMVNIDPYK